MIKVALGLTLFVFVIVPFAPIVLPLLIIAAPFAAIIYLISDHMKVSRERAQRRHLATIAANTTHLAASLPEQATVAIPAEHQAPAPPAIAAKAITAQEDIDDWLR